MCSNPVFFTKITEPTTKTNGNYMDDPNPGYCKLNTLSDRQPLTRLACRCVARQREGASVTVPSM